MLVPSGSSRAWKKDIATEGPGSQAGTRDTYAPPALSPGGQSAPCRVPPLLQEENQQTHRDEKQDDANNGSRNDPWGRRHGDLLVLASSAGNLSLLPPSLPGM